MSMLDGLPTYIGTLALVAAAYATGSVIPMLVLLAWWPLAMRRGS